MSKILMVDDSPTEIHVVREILKKKGHVVVTAASGEEGVEVAKAEKPDLILMDIVMPGMNGFKATRTISKDPETANIPIIMMSSKDQETDMEWAKRQGASGYVVKPAQEAELMAAIEGLLKG